MDLVIKIHDRESSAPLLEYGKLESAVLSPQTDYFGQVPYSTLFEKAAVLLSHIANAHAFLDGTGVVRGPHASYSSWQTAWNSPSKHSHLLPSLKTKLSTTICLLRR